MEPTIISLSVTAGLILLSLGAGLLLGRGGRPYGKARMGLHIGFNILAIAGYFYSFEMLTHLHLKLLAVLLMCITGLTILTNLTTGVILLFRRNRPSPLPFVHIVSSILMVLSVLAVILILVWGINRIPAADLGFDFF